MPEVSEELIRTLAGIRAPEGSMLSIYLDLDPERFATPPARQSEIDSLIDSAHRDIEQRKRPHRTQAALREGLARARELLNDPELPRGARAAAVFVCEPLALEQAVRITRPLESRAIVSDEAFIAPLLEGGDRGREEALLAQLRAGIERADGRLAVTGLEAVLDALIEQRVQALLYEVGLHGRGVACPHGDWMASSGDLCPLDGEPLQEREDIVEDAIHAALAQSAEVLALRDRPELAGVGGIAATLRF